MIKITFPDGSIANYQKGITPKEIAKGISNSLFKRAVGAIYNDVLVELTRSLNF